MLFGQSVQKAVFLSTLSLRRATGFFFCLFVLDNNFYPRSPCGERQAIYPCVTPPKKYFYPRSPCGERPIGPPSAILSNGFLSTLSLRRATTVDFNAKTRKSHFYPRSPCGERPVPKRPKHQGTSNFYPRSPCGERLTPMVTPPSYKQFLSTLSLRRATLTLQLT